MNLIFAQYNLNYLFIAILVLAIYEGLQTGISTYLMVTSVILGVKNTRALVDWNIFKSFHVNKKKERKKERKKDKEEVSEN